MTWSGLKSSGILTDAYTECVRGRQYFRAFLSDTRHTSFYADSRGAAGFHVESLDNCANTVSVVNTFKTAQSYCSFSGFQYVFIYLTASS